MCKRLTRADTRLLAARAVHKIDLLGPRGTTLCSMDEIVAMAIELVAAGTLPTPRQLRHARENAASTPPSTGDET